MLKKDVPSDLKMGADLHPTKWWDFYSEAMFLISHTKVILKILNEPAIQINSSGWVYSINANTTFNITSTLSLQANVNYLSKRPTAQGEDSRYLIPNMSLKKTFPR